MSYDPKQVVEEMGLDPEDMKEIYDDYFREVKGVFGQIDKALTDKDAVSLKALLHNVKGSSGNLQMMEIYELAARLEKAAIAGDIAPIAADVAALENMVAINEKLVNEFYG